MVADGFGSFMCDISRRELDERLTTDTIDGAERNTLVGIVGNFLFVRADQLELHGGRACVEHEYVHARKVLILPGNASGESAEIGAQRPAHRPENPDRTAVRG